MVALLSLFFNVFGFFGTAVGVMIFGEAVLVAEFDLWLLVNAGTRVLTLLLITAGGTTGSPSPPDLRENRAFI